MGQPHSVFAGAAQAIVGKRLLGEAVKPAGSRVARDLLIETRRLERFEPGAEALQLVGRRSGNGLFEFVDSHMLHIAR